MKLLTGLVLALHATTGLAVVPDTFCQEVQKFLASTELEAENVIYKDLEEFVLSKPVVEPLTSRQFVHEDGDGIPRMISCKTKTADIIRDKLGEDLAGEQRACYQITQELLDSSAVALRALGDMDAAAAVEAMVVEQDEPKLMGSQWVKEFPLTFRGDDGAIHVNSQSLLVRWEDWRFWIMPDRLRGTHYCHLIAPERVVRLARGEVEPGAP